MSNHLYAELAWLPRPPEDLGAQIKALSQKTGEIGSDARFIASHALDENQLNKLSRVLTRPGTPTGRLAPLEPFRLGILSNANSHFMVPALIATAARYGFALECVEGDFGQVMQEAISPESTINKARCDAVLLAIDQRGLPLSNLPGDRPTADNAIEAAVAHIDALQKSLHALGGATCIVQTLARWPETEFGSLDASLDGTRRRVLAGFNLALANRIGGSDDLLLDVAALAENVGLADWHDPTLWNIGKIPFANSFLPAYADQVCRLIAAFKGKSRRCLILDLDNTLWHGVIGDDGIEGILLGQGDATGEAHQQLQRVALALRQRGVVLAVSSKNNDEVARQPFRHHKEMVLREEHIAVFQANWQDKASNIKAIASELSLGLEAMVFVDDNPAERALVRRLLPQVAVPEMPYDAALYARTLLAGGYFEAVSYSLEDRGRAEFYQDNARRVGLQKAAPDLDSYLRSLNMTIQFLPFDLQNRARIAQLISKSSQYNLTTRRYGEREVERFQHDPQRFCLQVRLSDIFGDNGMISVIICRREHLDWDIDLWLMSCRVLGRGVEVAVLQEIVEQARGRGIERLIGSYLPTDRNELVRDHYQKLGFCALPVTDGNVSRWALDVGNFASRHLPMTVVRQQVAELAQ